MSRAIKMIDSAIKEGSLSEKEHDRIMELIHKDGHIDEHESEKLSELFQALKTKKVILQSNSSRDNNAHNEVQSLKDDALQRDVDRSSSSKAQNTEKDEEISSNIVPTQSLHIESSVYDQNQNENYKNDSNSSLEHLFGLDCYQIKDRDEAFYKTTDRMLEAHLNGRIWIKTGSMVAYQGAMKFRREGFTEHGLSKLMKRRLSGENTPLTAAEGKGVLFLADQGKKICLIDLKGVPIYVQSQHMLAFEDQIKWDVQPLFNIGTAMAGGLFHICFSGNGKIAFTSEFDPIVLRVSPGSPIMTDAAATVGWSSGVVPSVQTDINLHTLIGRGSGETLQLRFEGDGIIIIQPYETNFKPDEGSAKS